MKTGLAGYSGSGVTTLLALLSGDLELAASHTGPVIRSVTVDDPRLEQLGGLCNPKKLTPLQIDIAELGDLRPEDGGGLRKETLKRAAGLDALVVVLRGFSVPMSEECRPEDELARELDSLMQEFAIADLIPVENRLENLGKEGKLSSGEARLLTRMKDGLEEGLPVRRMGLDREELRVLSGYNFLTLTPLMVVANPGALGAGVPQYPGLGDRCPREQMSFVEIPALAELETLEIQEEERAPFLADLGVAQPAGKKFIKTLFGQLRLVTFFTVSEKEVRAWVVPEGTAAARAAGKIHTDMERGFIRAEVVSVDDCIALGGLSAAREAGKLRVEGKEYKLRDGEIVQVRFNV